MVIWLKLNIFAPAHFDDDDDDHVLWFLPRPRQAVVQETGDGGAQQQQAASPAVHVQMLDSQQIIKYEIIEASSPTGGNGTNTVTVSSAQHISANTPSSSGGAVVVTSNGGDGNCSDQMEWGADYDLIRHICLGTRSDLLDLDL